MPASVKMLPLGADDVRRQLAVSRETIDRFDHLLALLSRWQRAINLVSRGSLTDAWRRHVLNSGQLWAYWPASAKVMVDLGSGGGFPGLILAIMGAPVVHLVESDQRKAIFLREAARELALDIFVHACRAEEVTPIHADVLTARAVAPLPALLAVAEPFVRASTTLLLLKGRSALVELKSAQAEWKMSAEMHPSRSDPEGRVLVLRDVHRG